VNDLPPQTEPKTMLTDDMEMGSLCTSAVSLEMQQLLPCQAYCGAFRLYAGVYSPVSYFTENQELVMMLMGSRRGAHSTNGRSTNSRSAIRG
jgi:hypothetical protein